MNETSFQNPVFVYGALRSGTTFLHLILNGHPALHAPGEADYLFDHITPDPTGPGGWRYDKAALAADRIFRAAEITVPADLQGIDLARDLVMQLAAKAPGRQLSLNIHRNAHLMAAVFPDAKIIHLLRDPRDVARSCVGMGWSGNSYYGVHLWIGTESTWDAASIPEERVLTVRFEDLIADLEPGLTELCGFLDLPFDPNMLEYHTRSTYDPPDPTIAYKWRKKAGAREVALLEGRAGALMQARGYELAGEPARPGPVEKLTLAAGHRWKRWQYNIRRYGLGLFLQHHVARLAGLRQMEARLAARQEAIRVQNLK